MCKSCKLYTETYTHLYHGTTEDIANVIVHTKKFIPSKKGWCGTGVYFYDNKSKAWWSAKRTCSIANSNGRKKVRPEVIVADIKQLNRSLILDLRCPDDLSRFKVFVKDFMSNNGDFDIKEPLSTDDLRELKRALLLNFFCINVETQLVIGNFKQHPREENESIRQFAQEWRLVTESETIFCAKNPDIIHNIRRR